MHLLDDDDEHTASLKGRHVPKPKPPPKLKASPQRFIDHKEHRRRRKAQKKMFRHHRHFFRHALRAVFKDLPQPVQDRPWLSLAASLAFFAGMLAFVRRIIIESEESSKTRAHKKSDFDRWHPRAAAALPSWSAAALPPTVKKAAQRGEAPPVLQWLAANKPDARDASGRTALHWAAVHGHSELARSLVAGGCSPDAADSSGDTPLHAAADAGAAASVRALLDAGADATRRNAAGATAADLAAAKGNHGCARLVQRREREMAGSGFALAGDHLRSRGRAVDDAV